MELDVDFPSTVERSNYLICCILARVFDIATEFHFLVLTPQSSSLTTDYVLNLSLVASSMVRFNMQAIIVPISLLSNRFLLEPVV